MSRRHVRASLGCALMTVVLTACSVGDATGGDPRGARHGAQPGEDLTVFEAVMLYAIIPAVILLVIAALAWLPGVMRSSRYRPQRGWNAAPVWFSGPPDPAAAVEHAQVDEDVKRGGASGSW